MPQKQTPSYTWPVRERKAYAQKILKALEEQTEELGPTMIDQIVQEVGRAPFNILIACLLSLRARDVVTTPIARKLLVNAKTPQELLKIPITELEKLLYPLGFYRQKTKTLRAVSQTLIDRFDGKVPRTETELLSLPGVGRKTTNLVLSAAFLEPAICVDTHVHRLANKLGLVHTNTPEETEQALEQLYPKEVWHTINRVFVLWGQHGCKLHCPCDWRSPCLFTYQT